MALVFHNSFGKLIFKWGLRIVCISKRVSGMLIVSLMVVGVENWKVVVEILSLYFEMLASL